jgi:hypothetical protein
MCGTRVDSLRIIEENPAIPRWMWMAMAEHLHLRIEIASERKLLETEKGGENVELRRRSAYAIRERIGIGMRTNFLTIGETVICQVRRDAAGAVGVGLPLGGKGMTGATMFTTVKSQNTLVGRYRSD